MREKHTLLNIEDIDYDLDNPRIKKALEKYGRQISAERLHFALRSATGNGEKGKTASWHGLRDSIRASGGVMSPVSVVEKEGRHVCIDGNTRLAIYRQFSKENVPGDWSRIKAVILEDAKPRDIETIRISAHLVGAREWPPYEKARYLHYLRSQKFLDYREIIALCGGNQKEIERQIDAYHDMNEYYRDIVDDSAFHIERYSGFVELQRPKIKEAIFDAGLDLKDFGEWIRDGRIGRLEAVRQLPRVLGDDEARDRFLTGGPRSIEDAVRLLEQKGERKLGKKIEDVTLGDATIYELADILSQRVDKLPFDELTALQNRGSDESVERTGILENLAERLHALLENVSE